VETILLAILLLGSIGWIIFLFKRYKKIKELNYSITKTYAADYAKALKLSKEMHTRVIEMENGINETFSVSIRNDVTTVECVFNKIEMAFLMAGVYRLLNDANSTVDDKEFYIKLYKKIQKHISQMEDPADES